MDELRRGLLLGEKSKQGQVERSWHGTLGCCWDSSRGAADPIGLKRAAEAPQSRAGCGVPRPQRPVLGQPQVHPALQHPVGAKSSWVLAGREAFLIPFATASPPCSRVTGGIPSPFPSQTISSHPIPIRTRATSSPKSKPSSCSPLLQGQETPLGALSSKLGDFGPKQPLGRCRRAVG